MDHSVIGRRISEARLKLGMSTQQLAERIGKSQATVSRIENGKQGVTLPLLNIIARVLEIHPFTLLGDEDGEMPVNVRRGVLLRSTLMDGRGRARMSLEAVSAKTGIEINRLEGFENGAGIPDEIELESLCRLYPLDTDLTRQIWSAEQNCPRLVDKFNSMTLLLGDCLDLLQENRRNADDALEKLCSRIEDHLCISEDRTEGNKSYYSTAHLSDCLLNALQDQTFHAKAERLARDWQELEDGGNLSALRKIEGTLEGYSEQN